MNAKTELNILVVEDNPGDFLLLKEYLLLSQLPVVNIFQAEKIKDVYPIIKDKHIDAVLLDLTLSDSTGIDTVIMLDHLLPKIPIVVFSGLSAIEIAMESISLGAQDYLVKGEFDEKLLAKTIKYSIERKKMMLKLKESNEQYEIINMATNDLIWDWNCMTGALYMNKVIIESYNYDSQNNSIAWFYENVHPEDIERIKISLQNNFENLQRNWESEYRFRAANGSYKIFAVRGYVLYNEENKPYRMIGSMMDITEKRKMEKEIVMQQLNQQKLITETTIEAQENERNLLGKELHDNINQMLATVKMYIGIVKKKENEHQDLINDSYQYLDDAMEEIRKLSKTLVSPSLGDISFEDAIRELVEEFNCIKDLKIQLAYEVPKEQYINKKMGLMFYRIVQEQLNNILKYAKATKSIISFKAENSLLFLSITDNGVGFDPDKKAKGIGLKNIKSRVDFYAGEMKIISAPGQGCSVQINVPLNTKSYA